MTHSWTLMEDTKDHVFAQLRRKPSGPFQIHTCPRWLNKQLTFLMVTAQQQLMRKVLFGIQSMLHHANKRAAWATNFTSLLMLSMITESLQVAIRCKEATDKREGVLMPGDSTATLSIDNSEGKLDFLVRLYRKKYGATEGKQMTFNPLKHSKACEDLELPDQRLVHEVRAIIDTYRQYHVILSLGTDTKVT